MTQSHAQQSTFLENIAFEADNGYTKPFISEYGQKNFDYVGISADEQISVWG